MVSLANLIGLCQKVRRGFLSDLIEWLRYMFEPKQAKQQLQPDCI